MLSTLRIVILPFSRTSPFIQSTVSSVSIFSQCPEHMASSTEITKNLGLKNHSTTCVLPTVCSPKATFYICKLMQPFSPPYRKFDADTLFFHLYYFLGMPKSKTEQHTLVLNNNITKKSNMLQPYSKHEMTQQTLFHLHLAAEVSISTRSVN